MSNAGSEQSDWQSGGEFQFQHRRDKAERNNKSYIMKCMPMFKDYKYYYNGLHTITVRLGSANDGR